MSATRAAAARSAPAWDVARVRRDFPILATLVHGKPLVYLDNGATSQKPHAVIDAVSHYYETGNANVHRGVYALSESATATYEGARTKLARFLNAREDREIIYVRGTTEAINLVASSFGRLKVRSGDEILVSAMEHHSNIVPWQILAEQVGATIKVIPMNQAGELRLDEYEKLLTPRARLVAVAHISNSLGTINPIKDMTARAHARGVPVLVDGAQGAPHLVVDVQDLDCDFYTVSGHKMFGPTGIGVLYGKAAHLEDMPPYQGGGDMIRSVTFAKTTYAPIPAKFEAGTPDIAGVVGLGAAVDYLGSLDRNAAALHEQDLLEYGTKRLATVPGLTIVGTAAQKASVISFVLAGIHAHDVGTIVDQSGVAIRTGHHCTQPVMEFFGVPATARASFAFYNTRDEVDALVEALQGVRRVFG
ncbi:MAG TPA: cysteine desulfurase [Gemmatimonadales bacterium]|jgi:cysteine desulfurase/selenocysteine lyase|nr:cysteine desulfurase [Gemmatimonadales bacterium]